MNAQAAVDLLTPQKHAGQHSKNYMRSYVARQLNLAYQQSYSHIGSHDGFLPNNIFYSLRQNLGGFKKQAFGVRIFFCLIWGEIISSCWEMCKWVNDVL